MSNPNKHQINNPNTMLSQTEQNSNQSTNINLADLVTRIEKLETKNKKLEKCLSVMAYEIGLIEPETEFQDISIAKVIDYCEGQELMRVISHTKNKFKSIIARNDQTYAIVKSTEERLQKIETLSESELCYEAFQANIKKGFNKADAALTAELPTIKENCAMDLDRSLRRYFETTLKQVESVISNQREQNQLIEKQNKLVKKLQDSYEKDVTGSKVSLMLAYTQIENYLDRQKSQAMKSEAFKRAYMEGGKMEKLIERFDVLTDEKKAHILNEFANALNAIHAKEQDKTDPQPSKEVKLSTQIEIAEKHGITASKLAALIGVSNKTISEHKNNIAEWMTANHPAIEPHNPVRVGNRLVYVPISLLETRG